MPRFSLVRSSSVSSCRALFVNSSTSPSALEALNLKKDILVVFEELFTTGPPASADLTPLEFSSFALELLVALLSLEVATFQNE